VADVAFIATLLAFFALMVVFVRACDRIIGPEEVAATLEPESPDAPEQRSAA